MGKVAHTQLRANKRVWIEVEGVTTLNKCALEEGAAARERALRKIVAKLSYGINLQFYEPFIYDVAIIAIFWDPSPVIFLFLRTLLDL